VDAGHGDEAIAIVSQAAAWPADVIVLTRRPRPTLTRLVRGSIPDQVIRKASCPVLAVPPSQDHAERARTVGVVAGSIVGVGDH
jgi:nucleotide-binding universal stress UspA family protein